MEEHIHHETSDINIRGVLVFGAGLIAAALVVHVLIWLLLLYFSGRDTGSATLRFPLAVGQDQRLPPEPRLQTNPRQEMNDLRAQEDNLLNGYGWVDRNAGTVRIPIAEAMRLAVQRGLPTRRENAQ